MGQNRKKNRIKHGFVLLLPGLFDCVQMLPDIHPPQRRCIHAWRSHGHSFYKHLETTKSVSRSLQNESILMILILARWTKTQHNTTSLQMPLIPRQELRLTVICDDLLSILFLCGFVVDPNKVPLLAVGTAQIVHQVGSAFEASVALRRKTAKIIHIIIHIIINRNKVSIACNYCLMLHTRRGLSEGCSGFKETRQHS